jgi:hypothetical protein
MNTEILRKAELLASKVGYVFISTADLHGWPHITVAGRLANIRENHVLLTEWFCPGTMNNLQVNPRVSLVIWDSSSDTGYQLLGELEEIKELGILDGYSPKVEAKTKIPQIERQLLVHIDKILEFKRAPHTDTVENELRSVSGE